MLKENLEVAQDEPRVFKDVKYDLLLNHEIKQNFDEEYADIREKYMRRVEKFRIKIQSPTCFLRAVRDEEELNYIVDNQAYISRVIKRSNHLNEIVFLIPKWLEVQEKILFPHFILNIEMYRGDDRENLRGMLDNNYDIVEFLQKNITVQNIASNLMWDRKLELKKIGAITQRYALAIKLLNDKLDFSLIPQNIVIYGAGIIGKAFYNRCSESCRVECFVDRSSKEKEYRGMAILSLNRMNEIKCKNYVVTASYDMANIMAWFAAHYPDVNLIPMDSLFI